MASSSYSSSVKSFLLIFSLFFLTIHSLSPPPPPSSMDSSLSTIKSLCKSTPHPELCLESLKISISINITPNILSFILQTLRSALSEAGKLSDLLAGAGNSNNLVEKQRGTVKDCVELHGITVSALNRAATRIGKSTEDSRKLADAKAFLTAALTNKNTCMEGLDSASGNLKPRLVDSMVRAYKFVSNSLSILSRPGVPPDRHGNGRHLIGFPKWMSKKDRRVLETSGDEYDPGEVITVDAGGNGNFTTVTEAINFASNNSVDRIVIYVREGVYDENVEIPSYKTNIFLLGDGSDVTVITGNRSVVDGWTTFRSATVAVSGEGFLARDITFENRAGPKKQQAAALRINADLVAVYKCTITGFQDSLYVHSFRQFYRECNIYGTIDFIFGNAAVVFQGCNIVSRMPMPGQFTVITAQSRDNPDETSGISIQNCSIIAANDLFSNSNNVKSYLGRPWRVYSRTVYIESYIDGFIEPEGWKEWPGDQGLDTLYYGEYQNYGLGSNTENRVSWPGFHLMDYYEAYNFTVSEFITGYEWLDSTAFPYDDGI